MDTERDYSSKISQILEYLGMSSTEFARELGMVNNTTIRLILTENRKPSNKTIQKIVSAYPEFNPNWILYDQGSMILENVVPDTRVATDDLTTTSKQIMNHVSNVVMPQVKTLLNHQNDLWEEMRDDDYKFYTKKFDEYGKQQTQTSETLIKLMEQFSTGLNNVKEFTQIIDSLTNKIAKLEEDMDSAQTYLATYFELERLKKKSKKNKNIDNN
jgi:transcriptional regulator with XRE-family HTH domain